MSWAPPLKIAALQFAGFISIGKQTGRRKAPATAFGIDPLWTQYLRDPSDTNRNALMMKYLYIVKLHAARLAASTPDCVEECDLCSDGVFGLRDAITRFDPRRGIKFETFAARRVRGAMIDAMRERDWMSRLQRRRGDTRRQVSLHSTARDDQGDRELIETLPAGRELLHEREELEALRQLVVDLPRDMRLIFALYYFEDLTFKEIGRVIGVSESRVSQMHSNALLVLRAQQQRAKESASAEVTRGAGNP